MGRQKIIFLLCFFIFSFSSHAQFKNEAELKKQAAQYFEDEDYANGFKLYSQLVANYPKDPEYNYRLGVCMLFSDKDKKKCIPYLQVAIRNIKDAEKEVYFYLGKAYHLNFQFDEAIKQYNLYKQNGSSSMQKKLNVDHEMQACKNGKRLLANVQELVILDKKELSQADYFRSYDLKDIGGKLLVKPPDFISAQDKKKKDRSIIYLPAAKEQLYYASYGEKGDNKDIYIVRRAPNGDWGKPENLGAPVNTEFDEDFPFLHPTGKVLYFASKGHNTMGGYDIFKSELDESTGKWKEPINLDFPINSTNDDILFVTDSLEKIAFLASNRQSAWGKIDVYKILTERRPAEYAFIKGSVLRKNPDQSVQSKIKIKNIENGEDAGTFTSDANGEYSIKLANGGKYIFTVETPGFPAQSEGVTIPTAYNYKPYKQAIEYNNQKLQITNFFETNDKDENNYAQYLQLIEEKSKMNVNAADFDINPNNPVVTNTTNPKNTNNENPENKNPENKNPDAVATNTTSTNANNPDNKNTNKNNISTKELVKMASDDAKELQQNADSLKSDAATAFKAANSKQDQANEKKQELQDIQNKISAETDPTKKQELSNQAEKIKEETDLYTNQASTANNIAKQLEVDANNKQKEADLNTQYAKALEEAEKTKNNKQAIAKLEDLQKQLEEASKQKSQSNNLVESIKADAKNKDQELQNAEAKQEKLDNIITEFKKQLADLDKQQAETKDKALLENIQAQKDEVNTDLAEKEKESQANKNKIATLKDESDALKSQAEYATNVLSGNPDNPIAENNNQTKNTNITGTNNSGNQNTTAATGFEQESKKYNDELVALNNTGNDPGNNKKKEELLNQYLGATNKELATKKQELQKAKTQPEKTALNKEIKQLGDKKNELQKEVASVSKQVKEQEKQNAIVNNNPNVSKTDTSKTNVVSTNTAVTTNEVATNTTMPNNTENASNPGEDPRVQSINKLINESQNNFNEEKKVFAGVEYSDPKALLLKKQADDKFNGLLKNNSDIEQQLTQLKTQVDAQNGNSEEQKIQQLSKQADDLSAQSIQLRKDAKTMTGVDKQNALNKILSLDKQAADLRYQSAKQQYQLDDNTFASNKETINQLDQQTKNKQSAEAQQAKELVQQAEKIKNEASNLRQEAEADPSIEARTGALSNADEKEKEALAKQNEALALLKKVNPKANNTAVQAGNTDKQIADLQTKLAKETQVDNSALKLLTDANKLEYASALNDYTLTEKKSGANYDAQDLQAKALQNYKEATTDLTKIGAAKEEQKRELYLSANTKLDDAIKNIKQAKQALSGENVVSNNTENTNTVATNTVTENVNEINPVITNTTSAINTNTVIANTVIANTNTVSPANNETNVVSNNTVTTSNNNTVSPANNSLSEEQVKEIKNSGEYQKYTSLENNVNKYTDAANRDESQAKEENKKTEQLQQEAAALPEGPAKQQKELEARSTKQKADSLQEMASNTRSLAASKKQELDDYRQTLDKKTADNIAAVSVENTGTNSAAPQKYSDYSTTYRTDAIQKDEELATLRDQKSTPENLTRQNALIADYIKNINDEVSQKKKQQAATTDPGEKNKIAQQIKNLQTRKIELSNERNTNENILKFTSGTNVASNNTQPNNTQPNNNTNPVNSNEAATNPANNNTAGNTQPKNNTSGNTPANAAASYVNTEGFEVKKGNAYSAANPIPVDEKLPNGILFRVQIGAFKNPIPADRFQGLAPVGAENTPQGFVRYQVGLFTKFQTANAIKNDLRKLKYNDAFVVAYKNGKRISLAEALDSLQKKGEDVTQNTNSSAGISTNSNIPVNPEATAVTNETAVQTNGELNTTNGLLFTVQIGVYNNTVSGTRLLNLKPIYREALPTGYFRYTAGVYSNLDKVKADRAKVNALGIGDAFVSAYLNGQKIKVSEALDKISAGGIQLMTENPIIFPQAGTTFTNAPAANNITPPVNNNVEPFNNGVTEGPAPTAENGVKTNEEGITYKVQIGAYSKQVPANVANNWLKVKTWPIKYAQINNLYLYTVGSFTEARFAKKLKDEVTALGMTDAFVTVFKDGKKLYGAEAVQYLNR